MMDLPKLPTFDIPIDLKNKRPPNHVIYAWMDENLCSLKKSGQIERIRRQASRQPVDVPFVL